MTDGKRLTILVDMDGVVVDLMTPWLEIWNWENRDRSDALLNLEQLAEWDWADTFHDGAAIEILGRPGLFWDAKPYDGAIVGVKRLMEIGDVFFCTTPVLNSAACYFEKKRWIDKYFGVDGRSTKDLLIATSRKDLIRGDVLIEDNPGNLENFPGLRLLFDRPYNRNETRFERVKEWDEIILAIERGRPSRVVKSRFDRLGPASPGRIEFLPSQSITTSTGTYECLGKEIGKLVDLKNQAYGDSFNQAGQVLKIFYPDGVKPDQYRDMLAVVRIIDKMFRIATDKDAMGENPFRDIAGYGLLGMKTGRRIPI